MRYGRVACPTKWHGAKGASCPSRLHGPFTICLSDTVTERVKAAVFVNGGG